jgi:EAL domain-containing protein (putative c-di-GMP-specific phosphodiesterase class I)
MRQALAEVFGTDTKPTFLSLHYQPIVCAHTGKVYGAEALARYHETPSTVRSAANIVAAVEKSGHGLRLDRWVVRKAIRAVEGWWAQGCNVPVHVNVCGSSFDATSARPFYEWFARLELDYSMMTIEITEAEQITDHATAAAFVQRFRLLGLEVAIDDFGCGYSTLELLQRVTPDLLKIDRRFTSSVLTDSRTAIIVKKVIELAHSLGARTVAEGVETGEEWIWLRDAGCDFIQGYAVFAAMPRDSFPQWHRAWSARPFLAGAQGSPAAMVPRLV